MTRHHRFRRWLAAPLCLSASITFGAPGDAAGHWEGAARIPGAALSLIVDLAPEAGGTWVGSVTLPGRGVKGAALDALAVAPSGVRFGLQAAFSIPSEPAPQVTLQWQPDGSLAGQFEQAGLRAPVALRRSGAPQVDRPPAGTALAPGLTGTWRGRYELGGYPREVTLALRNAPSGLGGGELLIVGKRTTRLAIDRVVQAAEYLSLEAQAAGIRLEGRWRAAEGSQAASFDGQFLQGPFEAALQLHRVSADTGSPP